MLNDDRAAQKAEELLKQTKEKFLASADPYQTLQDLLTAELREAYDRGWLEGGQAAMERGFIEKETEIARLKTMSTVEMMCENLNVKHHVEEWERRCLKAEAEIDNLRAELQHWREAAASIGQPDGHGWAEETKSLRAALQKAAGFKVDRCACVFVDDEPTLECGYHQTLRAELAKVKP